ncbi:UDP-glycosyltransferase 86A1 isoform X2 [Cryptomeria japonica]|uniref:UDP-glycosyltransferase 86A1 isoform X2 n=1 Tax=Cryptomeria japonica TaxID=3369 RepID=UPI0027DA6A76|nr:UDP-glycosyltransferase 86A1 isoform X2 [Cryptomeria japonica]
MAQNPYPGRPQSFHLRSRHSGRHHTKLRGWGIGKGQKYHRIFSVPLKHGSSCGSTPNKPQSLGNGRNMYRRRCIPQMGASFCKKTRSPGLWEENFDFLGFCSIISGLEGLKDFIAGSPPLQSTDLPTYLTPPSPLVNEFIECFTNVRTADWIVANSFNALDFRAVEAQRHKTPVYCVGPLNMGFSSMPDSHCTEWLDTKPARSVIYVSFGSFITVARPQVREIADGLMKTGCYFVWALRPDKEASHFSEMLPTGFIDVCEGRGLIAAWFRQAEVLRHPAVGGFLSHCGWNAVMESVSAGVPMLGFPLAVDQFFNCRYIVDEWKFGLGLKNGDDGNRVVRAEEIESKVKMLMEGEESVRFRRAAERFRDLAEEEVSRGGPSATSLEALVNFINLNPQ